MRKYLAILVVLILTVFLIYQLSNRKKNDHISNQFKSPSGELLSDSSLIGRWKAVFIRVSGDSKSDIIDINLLDSNSIKRFTDTIFFKGMFGTVRNDSSFTSSKSIKEFEKIFGGMNNTFVSFYSDSTYELDNQSMIFGFAWDGNHPDVIKRKTWRFYNYEEAKEKGTESRAVSFSLSTRENRSFEVLKLTKDTLVIDDPWRENGGQPVKEITFLRQK